MQWVLTAASSVSLLLCQGLQLVRCSHLRRCARGTGAQRPLGCPQCPAAGCCRCCWPLLPALPAPGCLQGPWRLPLTRRLLVCREQAVSGCGALPSSKKTSESTLCTRESTRWTCSYLSDQSKEHAAARCCLCWRRRATACIGRARRRRARRAPPFVRRAPRNVRLHCRLSAGPPARTGPPSAPESCAFQQCHPERLCAPGVPCSSRSHFCCACILISSTG